MTRYGFGEQLVMSQGVCESNDVVKILTDNVPGVVNVHQAATQNDRNGTDYWGEHVSGKHLSIDVKARDKDYSLKARGSHDDLALETWSVVEKRVIGWTRNGAKRSDFILWLWRETGRWCLVPFPMLCDVFQTKWQEWSKMHKVARQFTDDHGGGYQSECVFVPRRDVWAAIYNKFSGNPKIETN